MEKELPATEVSVGRRGGLLSLWPTSVPVPGPALAWPPRGSVRPTAREHRAAPASFLRHFSQGFNDAAMSNLILLLGDQPGRAGADFNGGASTQRGSEPQHRLSPGTRRTDAASHLQSKRLSLCSGGSCQLH